MTDFQRAEQNFAKDLSNLKMMVAYAADMLLHGTVSQRRPDLGKMFTCPFCGTRRRQGEERCCNPAYAKTQRAWDPEKGFHQAECEERVNQNMFPKHFLKRLTARSKRHGQNRQFKVRELTRLFQRDAAALKAAAEEMGRPCLRTKVPDVAGIPAFAEKYWLWVQERRDRFYRRQAAASRAINRRSA